MLTKNILLSAILKVISLLTSFLIVPITITYLNNEVYGVWMTITSILFWINTFDIGLGNGMRNYLTEALSKKDYRLARSYISTTFIFLTIIAVLMIVVLFYPLLNINFNILFNTTRIGFSELRNAVYFAISFTILNFVVKNVGYIFVAMQKYAINDFLMVFSNVVSLTIIYILTKLTTGHLLYVVIAYTITPTLVFFLATIPLFKKHPELKPSLHYFDKNLGNSIVGKGLGFFVIQITSVLVVFGASNFFITQICGPEQVTVYNVAYKYFFLLSTGYIIIISPLWNAYTDAYVKGDMIWIERTFNRSFKAWLLTVLIGAVMLLGSRIFYSFWIGNSVTIPFSVSLCVFVYICFYNLNNCATYLINGLNKIKIQIITSLIFTIIYILTFILFRKKMELESIILLMASIYFGMSLIHLYQCRLLIKQKAKGIWNK